MSEYKTQDMKLRLSLWGSSYTWACGRRLYPVDLTLDKKRMRTCPGLDVIDRKRLFSAFEAISANEGALSGRYSNRCNLPTIRSNISRPWAEGNPTTPGRHVMSHTI